MGKLIGSGNTENFGENLFIDKVQEYLDDTNIIYWNRQVFGREFDVCILMPGKGILVVELKGWREDNILRVENNESVIIRTADGEVPASPQKQARGYRFSIERHIRQNIGKFPLVFQMVCLRQVSKAFFKSRRLDVVMEEKFTILREDLPNNTAFFNKLDQALRESLTGIETRLIEEPCWRSAICLRPTLIWMKVANQKMRKNWLRPTTNMTILAFFILLKLIR